MQIEQIWFDRGPLPTLARFGLIPASMLYGLGWRTYAALYEFGLKKAYPASIPVICIGNLTVGGAGKTPLTLHLIDVLRELGEEVVVGASGYGSPRAEAATLAPEGPLDAREWGDEPALLRESRPDLPLVIGRRRVLAAQLVERAHPRAVLLMDDGLQHLPLAKSLSILLDPPQPANGLMLPAGPYREPRARRDEFDLILNESSNPFRIVESPMQLRDPDGRLVKLDASSLLTAIARPERLQNSLAQNGIRLAAQKLLPDHDPLDAPDLLAGLTDPILVTGKDWVKLQHRTDIADRRFVIASREVRIEPRAAFAGFLKERLQEIRTNGLAISAPGTLSMELPPSQTAVNLAESPEEPSGDL